MGCCHGGWGSIKKDSPAAGCNCAFEDRLSQGAAQSKTARCGSNPEAFEFPGVRSDGIGSCSEGELAPCDEAGGLAVCTSHDAAASLFEIREWNPCGFFLKSSKTEAGCARLGNDRAAVLEQQFLCLLDGAFRGRCSNLFNEKWPRIGLVCGHA